MMDGWMDGWRVGLQLLERVQREREVVGVYSIYTGISNTNTEEKKTKKQKKNFNKYRPNTNTVTD